MTRIKSFAIGLFWTGLFLVSLIAIDSLIGITLRPILSPTSPLTWLLGILVVTALYAWVARRLPAVAPNFTPSLLSGAVGSGLLLVYVAFIVTTLLVIGDGYLKVSSPPHLFQPGYAAFVVCAALTEELLFRGLLLRTCMIVMPMFLAATVQASIFAAVHLADDSTSLRGLGGHFLAGLLFARVALLSGSTISATVLHAGMNMFSGSLVSLAVFGGWGVATGFRIDRAGFISSESLGNIRLACMALLLLVVEVMCLTYRYRRRSRRLAAPSSDQQQHPVLA